MHKEDIKTYDLSTPLYAKCDRKDGRLIAVYTYFPTEETDFDYNVIRPFHKFTVCNMIVDKSEITFNFDETLHEAYPNKQFGRLLYDIKTFMTCKGKVKKTGQGRLATFADKPDIFGFIEVDESDLGAEIIPPEIKERQSKRAIFNTFLKDNMIQRINNMKKSPESTEFESTESGLLSMHIGLYSCDSFSFSNELYDYVIKKGIQVWINEHFKDLGIELNNIEKVKLGDKYACVDVGDCDFNVK